MIIYNIGFWVLILSLISMIVGMIILSFYKTKRNIGIIFTVIGLALFFIGIIVNLLTSSCIESDITKLSIPKQPKNIIDSQPLVETNNITRSFKDPYTLGTNLDY